MSVVVLSAVIALSVGLAVVVTTNRALAGVAPTDLRTVRATLLDADRAFARASAGTTQAKGILAMMAADGMLVGSRREMAHGTAAIRAALLVDTAMANAVASWTPVRADVSADGNDGYTFGYYDLRMPNGVARPGKYLTYWRRGTDGAWRALAFKSLAREEGAPVLAPPPGFATPGTTSYRIVPRGAQDPLQELFETDRTFATLALGGAAAAFRAYTAPDGATLGSAPEMAWGPDKSGAQFESFAPGTLWWEPKDGRVAASNDLGFATGDVHIREKQPDGTFKTQLVVHYLTIWRRQANGSWRVVIDG